MQPTSCKGKCYNIKTETKYIPGVKMCHNCGFIKTESALCPCCNARVRSSPKYKANYTRTYIE